MADYLSQWLDFDWRPSKRPTLELVDASSCSRSNHVPFSRTFSRW